MIPIPVPTVDSVWNLQLVLNVSALQDGQDNCVKIVSVTSLVSTSDKMFVVNK